MKLIHATELYCARQSAIYQIYQTLQNQIKSSSIPLFNFNQCSIFWICCKGLLTPLQVAMCFHTEQLSMFCNVCCKGLLTPLQVAMRFHTEQLSMFCNDCCKGFLTPLQVAMCFHTEQLSMFCNDCCKGLLTPLLVELCFHTEQLICSHSNVFTLCSHTLYVHSDELRVIPVVITLNSVQTAC